MSTLGSLKSKILKGKVYGTDPVAKAIYTTFKKATLDTTLQSLDRILDKEHFALVVHQQRLCECGSGKWTPADGVEAAVRAGARPHPRSIPSVATCTCATRVRFLPLPHVAAAAARNASRSQMLATYT